MTPAYRDVEVGTPLTEDERKVLDAVDSGMSRADAAEKFGYASANALGNVYNTARTKVGRAHEISSRGGSGGQRKREPIEDATLSALRDVIDRMKVIVDENNRRVEEATQALDVSDEDMINVEVERLQDEVSRAQEALDNFQGDTDAQATFVKVRRENAQSQLEQAESERDERAAKAEDELAKAREMFLGYGGTPEQLGESDEADSDS